MHEDEKILLSNSWAEHGHYYRHSRLKRLFDGPLFALLSIRPLITTETFVFEGERYLEHQGSTSSSFYLEQYCNP